jgi:hypothetical protein
LSLGKVCKRDFFGHRNFHLLIKCLVIIQLNGLISCVYILIILIKNSGETHENGYADTDARDLFRIQWCIRNVTRQVTHQNRYADTGERELFLNSDAWELLCGKWRMRIVMRTLTHETCFADSDAWEMLRGKWRMSCLCWAERWQAALHSWPAAAAGGPSHHPFLQPGIRIRIQSPYF